MDSFSPTNFSRLIDNNRSLRRNRSNDEMDPEESLNSEEEEVAFEKWNPDVETVNINWKGWKRSEHPKLRRSCRPPLSKGRATCAVIARVICPNSIIVILLVKFQVAVY